MTDSHEEKTFSIELCSREALRNVTVIEESRPDILIKGSLGVLEQLSIIDDIVLEINGEYGTLRLDVSKEELETLI